jgi:hypothetical protein
VAANITPDNDTGIGKWSDEQIVNAIRSGKRPEGTLIGPAMPIVFYRNINPEGVSKWTDTEVKSTITTGVRPDGRSLVRTMAFDWYKNITQDDLDAVVVYLRTLKAAKPLMGIFLLRGSLRQQHLRCGICWVSVTSTGCGPLAVSN